ncbi:MAG: homocysteine S-methyltransferase family protein [Bacteroidales bacterium]|nr:homocysteine S-methyltransferase family protein [Bacteroidales bacterium]
MRDGRITRQEILARVDDRVIIMDGAMGTMLRGQGVSGNLSELNLTDPEWVARIHRSYIQSGAELIETNTFSFAASPGQKCCLDKIYELSRRGAEIARKVAEEKALSFMLSDDNGSKSWKEEWGPQRAIVAGCIGACNQTKDAFRRHAEGLIDGGADVLLVESIYDLANAEAALQGIKMAQGERKEEIPVMASATIDREGKILSGENFRTVFRRLKEYGLFNIGFNCSFGAEAMIPFALSLKDFATDLPVSICPSAGLPDNAGKYPEGPAFWASCIGKMRCPDGTPAYSFAGGCCGTTPEYIRALKSISAPSVPKTGTPGAF